MASWDSLEEVLAAPYLFVYEVTNAIHQRVRRHELSGADADGILDTALAMPVRLFTGSALPRAGATIARSLGLKATYDAIYLALAEELAVELWTADERLWRAARGTYAVHWIGESE
jgi:predicted nucleic acid-binding protein